MTKGIIYYTRNKAPELIFSACQKQIKKSGLPIVSISSEPISFGQNTVFNSSGDFVEMFEKILLGLEKSTADFIFFCEDDVLYHPSHFTFTPEEKEFYYYNFNFWRVRSADGHSVHYDTHQLNFMCGYREFLLAHYRKRVDIVKKIGYKARMGFEPGTHTRSERVDDFKAKRFDSSSPCLDIRHETNLTASRWSKDQFRSQKNCQNWKEAKTVEPWNWEEGNFMEMIEKI